MKLHRHVAGWFGYELIKKRKLNDTLDQHLTNVLREENINLVVDVGANAGQYAKSLRLHGYAGKIESFEPLSCAFAELKTESDYDPNWRSYQLALGTENKTVTMQRLVDVWPAIVEFIDTPRCLLKLDTQGFDLEVLAGAGDAIDDVYAIQAEISLKSIYDGAPRYLDALAEFESHGFEITGMYPVSRDKQTLAIVEYDCVMTRRP